MAKTFSNEKCKFRAYAVGEFEGKEIPFGFKTVKWPKKESLGLRGIRGPTPPEERILTYEDDKWVEIPEERLVPEDVDWGGIWCATTYGEASGIRRYFQVEYKYGPASVLAVLMDNTIMAKTDRVKCARVMSLGEIDKKWNTPEKRREAITEMAKKRGIKIEF